MPSDERFKIYIAAYLVLKKDGQILLSKRANTGYNDGNYSLVSGHFEEVENAKQCIIREGKEEVNIDLRSDDLEVCHVMHRKNPDRTYIDIYLTASAWEGELKNMEEDKCDRIDWFPVDKLPENIIPEVKLALENIDKNIFYGEIGW